MAEKKIYVDLNLNLNSVKNHILDKLGTPLPAGVEGRIVYNTADKYPQYYDGTGWRTMGSNVQSVAGTAPITVVTAGTGIVTIAINPATTALPGSLSAADKTKIDNLNQIDDDTDVPHNPTAGANNIITGTTVFAGLNELDGWAYAHTGSGTASSNRPHLELKQADKDNDGTLAANSDDRVPSQKAIKTYVDGLVSGSGRPVQPWDASGNTFPLLANGNGGTIEKGDQFIISVAGTLGGTAVTANDTIIANVTCTDDTGGAVGTQNAANWTIIASANVPPASESTSGIAALATQAEANAGTDDSKIITPLKMKTFLSTITHMNEATNAGAGPDTLVTVQHNWSNINVIAQAFETASGEALEGQITRTANNVVYTLNTAPGNAWTVIVIGIDKS